jgi:hypothetical protein
LNIYNNSSLTNVNGLSSLETVTGYVNFQSNPALSNVNGLAALTTVGGYLQFYSNSAITNVGGLSNLTTVDGYVSVYSNAALTTLDGLSKLAKVGSKSSDYLQIYANPVLASIAGLIIPNGSLTSLTGALTVTSNAKLTSCQPDALKTALGVGWTGTYSQSSNLTCATSCSGSVCQ